AHNRPVVGSSPTKYIRGCKKAALHQVIRPAKRKQCLMFLIWLVLLPQMQAFATPLSCHLQTQLSMLQAFP
ncbi:hypothetical protein, partial [Enterococcus faecium]|uniref:hypothetical protein n=1 Tax=Enterococcus faecium TaxID=1352 RepID=UPI0011E7746C